MVLALWVKLFLGGDPKVHSLRRVSIKARGGKGASSKRGPGGKKKKAEIGSRNRRTVWAPRTEKDNHSPAAEEVRDREGN